MKTYRVAILGCRGRGTAAARGYHSHARTEVVGLCDLIPERFNTLGDELGVPTSARYTDLDKMIEETQPDIVAIPTATELHYPLSMRVLEHGVHIDVEKPMTLDLIQADALIAKAQEKGARVAVHHQGGVGINIKAALKAYREGRIGELRYIHSAGKGYYGGFELIHQDTHILNNDILFAGRCKAVSAVAVSGGRSATPADAHRVWGAGTIIGEHLNAAMEWENGVTGTHFCHRFAQNDTTAHVTELYGTEGRIIVNHSAKQGGPRLLLQPQYYPDGANDQWQPLDPIYPEGYDESMSASEDDYGYADEYVRALDEGRDHACNGANGHHVVEIIMAIYESAGYGRRVEIPQQNREHPLVRLRREHGLPDTTQAPIQYQELLESEDRRRGAAPAAAG